MLKWHGPILCMGGDRGPKRIITWLLEGRKREILEMKSPEDAVNWQIWRKVTENQ